MRHKKYTLEEIRVLFQQKGCILLSPEYKNNNTPLDYICACGNQSKTRLRSFLSGDLCKKCSQDRAMITNKKNHGGISAFQTEEFNRKRKETFLKRYGVDSPLKNPKFLKSKKETCRQRYGSDEYFRTEEGKRRIKQTLLSRYGVEYSMQIPSAKEAFKKTLMKRYGVPSLAYLSRCASKQSQKLFWELYRLLPDEHQKHTYFAELNREYVLSYQQHHFKYDFVVTSLKRAIEFNGTNFHPRSDQDENEKGWCVFHPYLSVKNARINEAIKREALQKRGYELIYFWDTDLKNFQGLINRSMNSLLIHLWGESINNQKKEI